MQYASHCSADWMHIGDLPRPIHAGTVLMNVLCLVNSGVSLGYYGSVIIVKTIIKNIFCALLEGYLHLRVRQNVFYEERNASEIWGRDYTVIIKNDLVVTAP